MNQRGEGRLSACIAHVGGDSSRRGQPMFISAAEHVGLRPGIVILASATYNYFKNMSVNEKALATPSTVGEAT